MSPPPPKKQICASLQQQQQQIQEGSSKSKSIHSHKSEATSKSVGKQSNGAHSSNNNSRSCKLSSTAESTAAKSPPPNQRASSPTIHNGQQSSVGDRVKGESGCSESEKASVTAGNAMRNNYEPISPAASTEDNNCTEKKDENGSSASSHLTTLPTRCDYVNVIVSCKNGNDGTAGEETTAEHSSTTTTSSPSTGRHKASANSNLVTLSSERIFTDSYLHEAWEKCQYIDLFLYSTVHNKDETKDPHLQNLIPGHRILLSAYSDYIRSFVESYPEPVKFVEQLQSFLKDVISNPSEKESLTKKTKLEQTLDMRKLNLKALGMSSIPVLVFSVPLDDLHDLVKLMYRGEVKVDKSRIDSLQKSAFKLKVCLHCLPFYFLTDTFFIAF